MKNSYEDDKDFWDVDYKNLPEEIEEVVSNHGKSFTIEKKANISFDGKSYTVRIPKKIARAYKIKKGDKLKFIAKLYPPISEKKSELHIKLIQNE